MSELTHTGTIQSLSELESREYGNEGKTFDKRMLVLDTEDQYNPIMVFELGGKKADIADAFKVGDVVTVGYNVSCREYTDKKTGKEAYFTSLKGWKVDAVAGASTKAAAPGPAPVEEDNIPF